MQRTILRALTIVFASCALGLLVNGFRSDVNRNGTPNHLSYRGAAAQAWPPGATVSREEAVRLWNIGTLFCDARAPADYAAGHIANALSLPSQQFNDYFPKVQPMLTTESTVVIYCDGENCDQGRTVAHQLRELGYGQVRLLENGWTVWRRAGLPTQTGAAP